MLVGECDSPPLHLPWAGGWRLCAPLPTAAASGRGTWAFAAHSAPLGSARSHLSTLLCTFSAPAAPTCEGLKTSPRGGPPSHWPPPTRGPRFCVGPLHMLFICLEDSQPCLHQATSAHASSRTLLKKAFLRSAISGFLCEGPSQACPVLCLHSIPVPSLTAGLGDPRTHGRESGKQKPRGACSQQPPQRHSETKARGARLAGPAEPAEAGTTSVHLPSGPTSQGRKQNGTQGQPH